MTPTLRIRSGSAGALALLLLPLLAAAQGAGDAHSRSSAAAGDTTTADPANLRGGVAALAGVLASVGSKATTAELDAAARAAAGVPDAAAAFLAVGAAGVLPAKSGLVPLSPAQAEVLLRGASRLDHAELLREVNSGVRHQPTRSWRRVALDLLRWHAGPRELPLMARLATEAAEGKDPDPLLDPFQEAVTAVLERSPKGFDDLRWLLEDAEVLRPALVRAAGASGRPEALDWLAGQLVFPTVAASALQELERLSSTAPPEVAQRVAPSVRPFLGADTAASRRHAIRVLAALGDIAAVPALIDHLEAKDRSEALAAQSALRLLSGTRLPASQDAWRAWSQDESQWLRDESEDTIASLRSDRDDEVVAAIRSLSTHTLFRATASAALVPLVKDHPSAAVRGQACIALGQLGDRASLAPLVDALGDEEDVVRQQALRALRMLTGKKLPLDQDAWRALLEDTQ